MKVRVSPLVWAGGLRLRGSEARLRQSLQAVLYDGRGLGNHGERGRHGMCVRTPSAWDMRGAGLPPDVPVLHVHG